MSQLQFLYNFILLLNYHVFHFKLFFKIVYDIFESRQLVLIYVDYTGIVHKWLQLLHVEAGILLHIQGFGGVLLADLYSLTVIR